MLIGNIDQDLGRFKDIVKGRIRKDLRKYMSSGELIGRQGKEMVSIPIHQIGIPRLRYGKNEKGMGANGQGEGEGAGNGPKAGDAEGDHLLEVEMTVDELAQILGDELQLPRIEPKGVQETQTQKHKYTGITQTGPESLRHNKRTFKRALIRSVTDGTYNPRDPVIVPVREDKRYRTFEIETEPRSAAVIIYMMDVSGSMGNEQKEIVRSQAFWIDAWIRHNYEEIETRWIIHDASAREVDRHTFFHTRESGGTLISSAYQLCTEIIEQNYPLAEWNIYPFHFSDGDNWSQSDNAKCVELLSKKLVPWSNQFSYAQVDSPYGSGEFFNVLGNNFGTEEKVVVSRIPERDAIMDSIRELLAGGR
jgi:uncharacterized sporulation protein YeaH/YhbH (DUF444 family)